MEALLPAYAPTKDAHSQKSWPVNFWNLQATWILFTLAFATPTILPSKNQPYQKIEKDSGGGVSPSPGDRKKKNQPFFQLNDLNVYYFSFYIQIAKYLWRITAILVL